jgi:hypothetical protein
MSPSIRPLLRAGEPPDSENVLVPCLQDNRLTTTGQEADVICPGQGDGQATAGVWAAVAQTHAVLVLAAAIAVGTSGADHRARADAAGTGF